MFLELLNQLFPRILTQVNRDFTSKSCGSFDRNWWHYKIRDFSSIILQQGGYFIYQYSLLPEYKDKKDWLRKIAEKSVFFWSERALKYGAFEEYYPWEKGYPPLAFSTLAMAKLIDKLELKDKKIDSVLEIAAKQLLNRFEYQAANQQVAGLAALAVIRKIKPNLIDRNEFDQLSNRTLDLQTSEGWFTEYDGPDLGYLSVTMDCLWDLYDYTGDIKYYDSCVKALDFITPLVELNSMNIGMHNARNTDYIVPYGISRFLNDSNEKVRLQSTNLIKLLYNNIDYNHFLQAVDDRYWIHYIGHSVARAQLLNNQFTNQNVIAKENSKLLNNMYYPLSKYKILYNNNLKIIVSGSKGGIISIFGDNSLYSDYGWLIERKDKQFVTHWWNNDWKVINNEFSIEIEGKMIPHQELNITPLKHFVLRLSSFVLGSKIVGLLKKQMIFKNNKSNLNFTRKIAFKENSIEIHDYIYGIRLNDNVIKAPISSKRHVASADSFNIEDILLNKGFNVIESNSIKKDRFEANIKILC